MARLAIAGARARGPRHPGARRGRAARPGGAARRPRTAGDAAGAGGRDRLPVRRRIRPSRRPRSRRCGRISARRIRTLASRALDALVTTGLDHERGPKRRGWRSSTPWPTPAPAPWTALHARLRDDAEPAHPPRRRGRRRASRPDGRRRRADRSARRRSRPRSAGRPAADRRGGAQGGLAALHQLVLALGHSRADRRHRRRARRLDAGAGRGPPRARRPRQPAGAPGPARRAGAHAARAPRRAGAAAEAVGDAACLAPLAAAWTAPAKVRRGPAVAAAFAAIVAREGLTRRHAAVKDVIARWPQAAVELLGPRS